MPFVAINQTTNEVNIPYYRHILIVYNIRLLCYVEHTL